MSSRSSWLCSSRGSACSALAITAASTSAAVPGELAWFAPVLVIKLLLAHLLPEDAGR